MREAEIIRILTEIGAITIEEARERIGMDPRIPKGTMPKSIGSDKNIDMVRDKKREQGIDQEPKNTMDNKLKGITKSFSDAIEVDFQSFISIVEHQVGLGNFSKGNVMYVETDKDFIMFFSDGNWKYKTKVPRSEEFKNERMYNFIKISI